MYLCKCIILLTIQEPVSLLNTPHTFLEWRVRVYCKGKDEDFDEKRYILYVVLSLLFIAEGVLIMLGVYYRGV